MLCGNPFCNYRNQITMKQKIREFKLKPVAASSKKLLLITATLISVLSSKAQITLEYANDTLAFGDFYCTDIGGGDFKYVSVNQKTNGFSLYNMDMTPYLTNVIVPTTTDSIKNGFVVIYITKTLFDCDSTNIEYVFERPVGINPTKPSFRVFRTDGTLLLKVDSARGPYMYGGSFAGSMELKPIINTPFGTKLFLDILNPSGFGIKIYSLCDELPTSYLHLPPYSNSYLKVYPNPTNGELIFDINYPSNIEEYQLQVVDVTGQLIKREKISQLQSRYVLDVSNFSSGTYFYSLTSKSKSYQTGKFVMSR